MIFTEIELRKKLINLNNTHLSRFKSDLFDESIDLNVDNLDIIQQDINSILEIIPSWIDKTYGDETDIREYYNKLNMILIKINSSIDYIL